MDDRNAARQIADIFGRSCREPGNDPGLDPALDSAAEVVASVRAEARTEYRVELDAYIRTLRNFRDNWDCDEDAHAHGTTCRACEAADVLSHFARAAILSDEPKEREVEIIPAFKVYNDGSKFCAVTGWFLNLQESESGWGDTPVQALSDLIKTPTIDPEAIRDEKDAEIARLRAALTRLASADAFTAYALGRKYDEEAIARMDYASAALAEREERDTRDGLLYKSDMDDRG